MQFVITQFATLLFYVARSNFLLFLEILTSFGHCQKNFA